MSYEFRFIPWEDEPAMVFNHLWNNQGKHPMKFDWTLHYFRLELDI